MRFSCSVLAALLLCGCGLQVSGFRLEASHREVLIAVNTSATIMCKAVDASNETVPISRCQFLTHLDDVIDLSAGAESPHSPLYQYSGAGLRDGECGVVLRGFYEDRVFFRYCGCRVRGVNGGHWQYADFIIRVDNRQDMRYSLEPREAVVSEGSDFNISGVADRPLTHCHIYLPDSGDTYLDFNDGPNSNTSSGGHRYLGSGLSNKECGISLRNVSASLNGRIIVYARQAKARRAASMTLIVATTPDKPLLTRTNPDEVYYPGNILQATCVIANSRPVSNITWLLDDVVLRDDTIDEPPEDDSWRWSYDLQTITQHLNRTLSIADAGKQLTCRAGHMALPGGTISSNGIHIIMGHVWPGCWPWFLGVVAFLVTLLLVAVPAAVVLLCRGKRCCSASAKPYKDEIEEDADGYLAPFPQNPQDQSQEASTVESHYTYIPVHFNQPGQFNTDYMHMKKNARYLHSPEPEYELYADILNVQPPKNFEPEEGNVDTYMNENDRSYEEINTNTT